MFLIIEFSLITNSSYKNAYAELILTESLSTDKADWYILKFGNVKISKNIEYDLNTNFIKFLIPGVYKITTYVKSLVMNVGGPWVATRLRGVKNGILMVSRSVDFHQPHVSMITSSLVNIININDNYILEIGFDRIYKNGIKGGFINIAGSNSPHCITIIEFVGNY